MRRAIKKYGIENFTKTILDIFLTEVEMNAREIELVTEEFCARDDTYNICLGGQGGFGYVNQSGLAKRNINSDNACEYAKRTQIILINKRLSDPIGWAASYASRKTGHQAWLGRTHSEETKEKMRKNHSASSHPIGVKRGPYKKRQK